MVNCEVMNATSTRHAAKDPVTMWLVRVGVALLGCAIAAIFYIVFGSSLLAPANGVEGSYQLNEENMAGAMDIVRDEFGQLRVEIETINLFSGSRCALRMSQVTEAGGLLSGAPLSLLDGNAAKAPQADNGQCAVDVKIDHDEALVAQSPSCTAAVVCTGDGRFTGKYDRQQD